MPRSYQVTPVGPDHRRSAQRMKASPTGGSHGKSQIASGQDPNHRDSGNLTLTLTPTVSS